MWIIIYLNISLHLLIRWRFDLIINFDPVLLNESWRWKEPWGNSNLQKLWRILIGCTSEDKWVLMRALFYILNIVIMFWLKEICKSITWVFINHLSFLTRRMSWFTKLFWHVVSQALDPHQTITDLFSPRVFIKIPESQLQLYRYILSGSIKLIINSINSTNPKYVIKKYFSSFFL